MPKIKIATFNVNSVKARLPNLLSWLETSNPDIVLLQELKCVEENFPFSALFDAGYNVAVSGQKTYNGVAILSKFKMEDVIKELPILDELNDEQARYIEALIPMHGTAIRVSSIYVPNGGGEILPNQKLEETAKFQYKMKFFDRLNSHFKELLTYDEIQIFGGDYNVGVEEIDVFDAKSLNGTVCFHNAERQKFRSLLNLGLTDSYRAQNQESQAFSWWDYRGGSWQHNKGMRIDYLLTSPLAADKIINTSIEDKGVRDQEKASDHCPVCVEIEV
jgi:exodeoxyribonuclease III